MKNNNHVVDVDITVNASLKDAFKTFTERGHEWWPADYKLSEQQRSDIIMEPRVGGRWFERCIDGSECDWGKVIVWEPPYHLVISWQIGVDFQPNSDPEKASIVDVRFSEIDPGKTRIHLTHSNFEQHGEGWETMRDSIAGEGGWHALLQLFQESCHNPSLSKKG